MNGKFQRRERGPSVVQRKLFRSPQIIDWRVAKVLSLMQPNDHQNGERPLLAELANAVNLSGSRLRHIITAQTGLPPGQLALSLRLEQARELLESGTLSIKEVMVKAGFEDKSNFIRQFKRGFSATPSSYQSQFLARPFQISPVLSQSLRLGAARFPNKPLAKAAKNTTR